MSDVVDYTNYQPQHAPASSTPGGLGQCRCGNKVITVPEEELIEILKAGGIPVVQFILKSDDLGPSAPEFHASIMVRDSREWPDYVAISYVWSDGIGNPLGNGIFMCQYYILLDYVHRIWQALPNHRCIERSFLDPLIEMGMLKQATFFLDTVCVPKDPHWRTVAIGRMAKVYKDAAVVLVVDAELRQIMDTCNMGQPIQTYLDTIMRLGVSRWMQIVWTLQGGLLAQMTTVLLGQSSGGNLPWTLSFFNGDSLEKAVNADLGNPHLWFMVFEEAARPFIQMGKLRSVRSIPPAPSWMWQFFSLLNGRTTTMTDDESIILNMICADAGLDREKEIESSIQRNDLHMADMLKALPMAADEESQRNLPSEVRVRAYFESQTCLAKTCNIPSRPKAE